MSIKSTFEKIDTKEPLYPNTLASHLKCSEITSYSEQSFNLMLNDAKFIHRTHKLVFGNKGCLEN